ncbi:MAG TPA: protein-disulfide reductase DsbD domain-containing protein, partial [Acidocella sp.]|nr:protein-disulfide reductase DsbD domain-containing protein [Acidocella sp.]
MFLLLLLLPRLAFAAASENFTSAHGTVRLVSESNEAAGGQIRLALEFLLQPGWHIYWQNPGDAGFAPQVRLETPAVAGALEFPPPELLLQGGVVAYVLSGHVVLPFTAQNVGGQVVAKAHWLVCADICVPEHAEFTLPLPGGASAEAGLFAPNGIVPSPFAATLSPDGILRVAGLGPGRVSS